MKKDPIIPQYGPLYGMRVLLTGSALAGPWAARMMGDYGAEVIKIEQPGSSDSSRIIGPRHSSGILPKWDSLGRNKMGMELDLNFTRSPASREVFTDLCGQCDVWINNIPNIGKHGATDELALSANPKLIICHTTGFGLPQNGGDPGFLNRTCVDSVGQAFSGLASLNGMPDGPFITANPIMADLTTALISVAGIMAAYYSMLKTGKGQVIDNSMYEASAYSQHYTWAMILNGGGAYQRFLTVAQVVDRQAAHIVFQMFRDFADRFPGQQFRYRHRFTVPFGNFRRLCFLPPAFLRSLYFLSPGFLSSLSSPRPCR